MTTEASKSDSLTAFTQIRVGGVEIPFLGLSLTQEEAREEATFTIVSKYAGQLRVNSAVEICFSGESVFTGLLLAHVREGDNIICRAASSVVTADLPLWERYDIARSRFLKPLETLPFVEKTTQAD